MRKRRDGRPTREVVAVEERHPAFVEVLTPARAAEAAALSITLVDGARVDVTCRGQLPWVAELLRHLNGSLPC